MIEVTLSGSFATPNVWSSDAVTCFRLRWQTEDEIAFARTAGQLPAFLESLSALPARDVVVQPLVMLPLPPNADLVAALATIGLNLQRLMGLPVEFWSTRTLIDLRAEVVVASPHPDIARSAMRLARDILHGFTVGHFPAFDIDRAFNRRFRTLVRSRASTGGVAMVERTAKRRCIPVSVADPSRLVLNLGNGKFTRRYSDGVTGLASAVGGRLTQDKHLTSLFLKNAGLPAPSGGIARTAEEAAFIANEIGYPVAMKPVDMGGSVGVFLDLQKEVSIHQHFQATLSASPSERVLIQKYLSGRHYRVLVINESVFAVFEIPVAKVVGDGIHSIGELVTAVNAARSGRQQRGLKVIVIESLTLDWLARHGKTIDDIPGVGDLVQIKPTGSGLAGRGAEEWIDVTEQVHQANIAIFLQAQSLFGLDVATFDVVTPDISQSMRQVAGGIVDINAGTEISKYERETGNDRGDPSIAIIEMLFPPGAPVRAPIVAVIGNHTLAGEISEWISRFAVASKRVVGIAAHDKVVIDGIVFSDIDPAGGKGAQVVLNNPVTEFAVLAVDSGQIVDRGLGFDYCDVAVIGSLSGLETPYGTPVEGIVANILDSQGGLVLDADDAETMTLREGAVSRVILCSQDSENLAIQDHVAAGAQAVVVTHLAEGPIVAVKSADGDEVIAPLPDELKPDAVLPFLLAIAAAIASHLPMNAINHSLSGESPH